MSSAGCVFVTVGAKWGGRGHKVAQNSQKNPFAPIAWTPYMRLFAFIGKVIHPMVTHYILISNLIAFLTK